MLDWFADGRGLEARTPPGPLRHYTYHWLTGREGMGGGDIKLLAMIGAFLGWQAVPVTLMIASLTGTAIGIGLMLVRRRDRRTAIPFGPFLAVGAACALFWGDALITWYLGLARPA